MRGLVNAVIASSDLLATLQLQGALRGYTVTHIDHAEQLLLEVNALEPKVVFVHDSLRGSMPAAEIAALLSRRAELRGAWVCGAGDAKSALRFHAVGVPDFEPAPFDPTRLKARLEAALKAQTQHREQLERLALLETKHAALLEDERMKDRLTHMLVHDLKNPIGAVIGSLDFVLMDSSRTLTAQQRQLIEMALEESNHLLHLTTNILDVRKMRDGKLTLELRAITRSVLMRIINAATEDIGPELKKRRARWRIAEDMPIFYADADVLRRVFANLISNAVKHTQLEGRVQIEARGLDADTVELVVHDDGEGIPEEDLEKIFNDFERSRVTNTTRFDTGMGLAFCKLAVEQHEGRIWARSKRGQGSSFYFALPIGTPSEVVDDPVELLD
jgi:signal transduction histidine kinase